MSYTAAMDDPKPETLYDEDYFAWSLAQAEALRARGRGGNAIDFDHVAEEIEDLGRSELRACEGLVRRIVEHLLKLATSGREEPKPHWRADVTTFRTEIDGRLTATIRASLAADLPRLWRQAVRIAAARLAAEEPGSAVRLPMEPTLGLDEVLDLDWWPPTLA